VSAPLLSLIGRRIRSLREQRAMLDALLGEVYRVQTRLLVQAVKCNSARFPEDFMFQLDARRAARGGQRSG